MRMARPSVCLAEVGIEARHNSTNLVAFKAWLSCEMQPHDSAKPYFKFPSSVAHAWATAELAFSLPGGVAQPPFSTKLPCM